MKNNKSKLLLFIQAIFFIGFFGCASTNQNKQKNEKEYTTEDIIQNEIKQIKSFYQSDPARALWRAKILDDEAIIKECFDLCILQLNKSIEEKDYFEAYRYCISLKSCGWDGYKDALKKIESFYSDDIPGLSKKTVSPSKIADCINATVTIWVDKGLKMKNGAGYADIVLGSGFFIDKRGYIVTNHHVITDLVNSSYSGYSKLYIKLQTDIDTKIPAKVVGYDPILDLALLKTEIEPDFILALGESKDLSVGDKISAIGSPIGLDGTLTSGIISSVDRKLLTLGSYFQVDAAINSGNSGGPLIDKNNNVQAVVFAGMLQYQGLNFAIPVEYLRQDLPALYAGDEVSHSWIGAFGRTKRRGNKKIGLDVQYVMPGSVAERSGIKAGDVIVQVDNKDVFTIDDFQYVLMGYSTGTVLQCKILTSDEIERSTFIYLEKRPEDPVVQIYESDLYENIFVPFFGLKIEPASSSRRKTFNVSEVIKGSTADEMGFSENDIIVVENVKLDKKNKYFIAQIKTQRRKKGFMEISLTIGAPFDSPYYF